MRLLPQLTNHQPNSSSHRPGHNLGGSDFPCPSLFVCVSHRVQGHPGVSVMCDQCVCVCCSRGSWFSAPGQCHIKEKGGEREDSVWLIDSTRGRLCSTCSQQTHRQTGGKTRSWKPPSQFACCPWGVIWNISLK